MSTKSATPTKHKKISPLMDNPPLANKKWFLISMISPTSLNKHKVHAIKIHDIVGDEEEANLMCEYYQDLDPAFYVYKGKVGNWCPWAWNADDIPNAKYADEKMCEIMTAHRVEKSREQKADHDRVTKFVERSQNAVSKEEQAKHIGEGESKQSSVQVWYRIKQIEKDIAKRQAELTPLSELFNEKYTQEEKDLAYSKEKLFPLSELTPYSLKTFTQVIDDKVGEPEASSSKSSNTVRPVIEPVVAKSFKEINDSIEKSLLV